MKILYGVKQQYVDIVKQKLFKEGIPLVGYQPGRKRNGGFGLGKFIVTYPNGKRKIIPESKEMYRNRTLFNKFTDWDWGAILNELRMTAMEGGL
jgi:hypothetical protein